MPQKDFSQASSDSIEDESHHAESLFNSLLRQFEADYALNESGQKQKNDQDQVTKKGTRLESSLALIGLRLNIKSHRLLELATLYPSCLRELKLYFQQQNLRQQAINADWQDDLMPQALVQYLNYIARQPEDHQIRLYCGRLLIQRGELDAAATIYQRGLEYGEDAFLLALKAELYLSQAKFIEAYNTAVQARYLSGNHKDISAKADIELIYFRSAQWLGKEDLIHFPLMELSQQYPDHLLLQSQALSQANPYHKPSHQLEEVYQAYQQRPHRYLQQAYIHALIRAQDYQEAYQEAQSLFNRLSHDSEALLSLIVCALHLSKFDEAVKYCESLRKKLPLSVDALVMYLMSLSKQGQSFDTLQPLFEILYNHAQHSPRVALYCTDLLNSWDKTAEAKEILRDLMHNYPKLFRVQISYVEHLIRDGQIDVARQQMDHLWLERSFERHLDKGQTNYPQKMHLISAEIAMLNQAEEEFLEHLALCSDQPYKTELEIRYFIRNSDFEQAKSKAMELCRSKPNNSIYPEYLINMIWQTETEVLPKLLELEQGLSSATRQAPLLSLLAYLLVKQGELEVSYTLCEEVLNLNKSVSLSAQRFLMACETAYLLKHKEALIAWSQKAMETHSDHPKLQFYAAMGLWYSGEFEEAFLLSLNSLEAVLEDSDLLEDAHFAEQLLITTIWGCELENYPQAKALLELLSEHEASDPTELEALTLRIYLNHDEEVIFNQGLVLSQTWLQDSKLANYQQKLEFLVDWLLESIPVKSLDGFGGDEELFDDQPLLEIRHEERLTIALSLLNQYIDNHPQDISVWRRLAAVYLQLEDFKSALFCLEHICELDDCLAYDYYMLSKVFENSNEINQARLSLEKGLKVVGQDERFNYLQNLACILIKQGDLRYAQHVFETLIDQVYEQAQNELKTLENKDPKLSNPKQNKKSSSSFSQQAQETLIIEEWKVEVYDTSVSELLHLWLAQSLNECDLSDSLALAERLSKRYSVRIVDAYKGLALAANGQSAVALPFLEMAHEELGILSGDYAQCLWTLGQREEAINILYSSLSDHSHEPEYYISLVKWLTELKRFQEAYPLYLDLITLAPKHEAQTELKNLMNTELVYH